MALFFPAYQSLGMIAGLAGTFQPAYNIVKVNEGGYANLPNDKGGETYAGISRVHHPGAEIWGHIDRKKWRYANGVIPHNTRFGDLDFIVERFYRGLWDQNRFGEILNQDVANLLYDFFIHSGYTAIKFIQRIVGVKDDGIIGPITLGAINAMDPAVLHDQLKAERLKFLQKIVATDPTQQDFEGGWLARIARFPTLLTEHVKPVVLIGGLAAVALVLVLVSQGSKKRKPKKA